MRPTLQQRFEAKISPEPSSGCWLWTARRDPAGYGLIWVKGRAVRAHRVAWELYCGEISPGKMVCHHCDLHDCVNPEHLFLGTARENAEDMKRKGRSRRGERNGAARLTWKQVQEIRLVLEQDALPQRRIANLCGISVATVSAIKCGRVWREETRKS